MKHPSKLKKDELADLVHEIQKMMFSGRKRTDWDAEFKYDIFNKIVDVLYLADLTPTPEEEAQDKRFAVYVHDEKHTKYLVAAPDSETARRKVEASECADEEFSRIPIGSKWYIERVEAESP